MLTTPFIVTQTAELANPKEGGGAHQHWFRTERELALEEVVKLVLKVDTAVVADHIVVKKEGQRMIHLWFSAAMLNAHLEQKKNEAVQKNEYVDQDKLVHGQDVFSWQVFFGLVANALKVLNERRGGG